jgi:hypothetical protein
MAQHMLEELTSAQESAEIACFWPPAAGSNQLGRVPIP